MSNPLARLYDAALTYLNNAFHERKGGVCQPDCWCQVAERVADMYLNQEPIVPKDRYELEAETSNSRELVIHSALSVAAGRSWADTHPEDPGWDVEYREDGLDQAVREHYLNLITLDSTKKG